MMRAVYSALEGSWRLCAGRNQAVCTSLDAWATLAELDAYLRDNGLRRVPAAKSLDWRVLPSEYAIVEA